MNYLKLTQLTLKNHKTAIMQKQNIQIEIEHFENLIKDIEKSVELINCEDIICEYKTKIVELKRVIHEIEKNIGGTN